MLRKFCSNCRVERDLASFIVVLHQARVLVPVLLLSYQGLKVLTQPLKRIILIWFMPIGSGRIQSK
jgi:hypothetical protein